MDWEGSIVRWVLLTILLFPLCAWGQTIRLQQVKGDGTKVRVVIEMETGNASARVLKEVKDKTLNQKEAPVRFRELLIEELAVHLVREADRARLSRRIKSLEDAAAAKAAPKEATKPVPEKAPEPQVPVPDAERKGVEE